MHHMTIGDLKHREKLNEDSIIEMEVNLKA